jgi:hypothetical protein
MNVLIVNGRKINSFSLAIEAAVYYRKQNFNVFFLDLDILSIPWSKKKIIQKKIFKKYNINLVKIPPKHLIQNLIYSSKISNEWLKLAYKSVNFCNLKSTPYDLPVGNLIKSLLARQMGSPNFQLRECQKFHLEEIIFKYIFSYLQISHFLKNTNLIFELGLAHGGRDSYSAGAVSAFKLHKIKNKLLEMGGIPNRWSIFDTSPHYAPDFWDKLEKYKKFYTENQNTKIWWKDRILGSDYFRQENWSQTRLKNQLPKNLPETFVTFFTTSEFEISVFPEFDFNVSEFRSQFDALSCLIRCAHSQHIPVVIRRHPNSVDSQGIDREIDLWRNFTQFEGVIYIKPSDKVDSILLAQKSKVVYTYKSSVGIEANYLGVPSFAMGPARWAWNEELRVWNSQRVEETIKKKQIVNRSNSIIWGNMMLNIDNPNLIFNSIAGNFSIIGTKKYSNSKISDRLNDAIRSIFFKFTFLTLLKFD